MTSVVEDGVANPARTVSVTGEVSDASERGPRMTDLEGYRGLAAVGIVVFHAYQFARGDASASYAYPHTAWQHILRNLDGLVSLFLILSGFLLYLPVVRNVLAGRRGVTRVFLLRRAVRILPLYWLAILIVWSTRNPALPGDWRDLVEHLTFTQVFDSKRIFYTIGPAWSLSVEVWFYLFLAAVYVTFNRLAPRISSRPGRIALLCAPAALLTIGSLSWQGWALLVSHEPATRWAIWFNPVARADMVAAGMIVAVILGARPATEPVRRSMLYPVRLVALGLLAIGCAIRTDAAASTATFNLLSTVAFALLIGSSVFDAPNHLWRRMLAGPRLAWLGLISYSIYMWHEPVLLYLDRHPGLSHAQAAFPLTAAILLATSIPIGWLSYRLLEKPIGRFRLVLDDAGRRRDYYPAEVAAAS